jgi:hypothetical protein
LIGPHPFSSDLKDSREHDELSRHARNEMRLYGIDRADVEASITDPVHRELDVRGNARLAGQTGDGRPILVVVAGDDPDFVITVILRSR